METEQYIVALEIASSKIVGAVAKKDPYGGFSLLAIEEEPHVDCVKYGCIQNVEECNLRVNRIINKLENRVTIAPRKIKSVFVGIEGNTLRSLMSHSQLTLSEEATINEKHIESLKESSKRSYTGAFEVLDVIPCRYSIDKNKIKNPIGIIGSYVEAEQNLILAKQQIKMNIRRVIEERSQLKIKGYIITPIAVGEKVLTYDEVQLGCMLVDFGAETTKVSFYKNDSLIYLATMPIGSRNITRDISTRNLVPEKAEDLKKKIGNALMPEKEHPLMIEGINSTDVSNIIVARAGEIAANITAQIEYAGFTSADLPAGIILIGGGSNLKGFPELMKQQTNMKVRLGNTVNLGSSLDNKEQPLEHIEILSILSKGSELLNGDESCCEKPFAPRPENDGYMPQQQQHQQQHQQTRAQQPTKPHVEKKPSKLKTFIKGLKTSAENIFSENDANDE